MLNKTAANCRKIHSRAKAKIAMEQSRRLHEPENTDAVVTAFLKAARSGEVEPFARLLAEDAVLYSDGGGRVPAAIRPIETRERILRFLFGLVRKAEEMAISLEMRPIRINSNGRHHPQPGGDFRDHGFSIARRTRGIRLSASQSGEVKTAFAELTPSCKKSPVGTGLFFYTRRVSQGPLSLHREVSPPVYGQMPVGLKRRGIPDRRRGYIIRTPVHRKKPRGWRG